MLLTVETMDGVQPPPRAQCSVLLHSSKEMRCKTIRKGSAMGVPQTGSGRACVSLLPGLAHTWQFVCWPRGEGANGATGCTRVNQQRHARKKRPDRYQETQRNNLSQKRVYLLLARLSILRPVYTGLFKANA